MHKTLVTEDIYMLYQLQQTSHEEFINHLMANKATCCNTLIGRYCSVGTRLRAKYEEVARRFEDLKDYI